MGLEIESVAFKQATLRSERLRMIALIGVLIAMAVVVTLRPLLAGDDIQMREVPRMLVLIGVLAAFECVMLSRVSRTLRENREPPGWTWFLSAAIELAAPTAAIFLLTHSSFMGPYRALTAPAILAYFIFIILSTLRLSPAQCVLTGVLAAAGYWSAVAYTRRSFPDPPAGALETQIYITYGVVFLIGGLVAGGVARQIRAHVHAALREAETRREIERLEHDLDIARSIQQGLLPSSPPEIDGFEIAGWSQPADQTGGDYFDWQRLSDGRLAISLADVTGHGIGPALVTAVCRAYSRASFSSGDNLETLMGRINDLLVEDLPPDRFVTFVVGILDPRTARIQLLSAGHGPILVYNASNDTVEDFNADDMPFGIVNGLAFGAPRDISPDEGDMLVLVTDGFFEWANADGELFGIERLKTAVRDSASLPAAEVIRKMHEAVLRFADGSGQQDDLTAVVLKRVGCGDAHASEQDAARVR